MSRNTEATLSKTTKLSQSYAKWLWLCSGLFALRVVAQAVALRFKSDFLPDFESWHGGALSYPILLIAQVFILTWFVWTARRFSNSVISPNRRLGLIILIFSSLYFIVMLLRLLLGLTIMNEHRWFASYLPAFFHLVLASYLFLYAHFHFRHGK